MGKPKTYDAPADRRIPAGFARWTAPLLTQQLGEISGQHIWRILCPQRIDLVTGVRAHWKDLLGPRFEVPGD